MLQIYLHHEFKWMFFKTRIISRTVLKVRCTDKAVKSIFLIYSKCTYQTLGLIILTLPAAALSKGSWQIYSTCMMLLQTVGLVLTEAD